MRILSIYAKETTFSVVFERIESKQPYYTTLTSRLNMHDLICIGLFLNIVFKTFFCKLELITHSVIFLSLYLCNMMSSVYISFSNYRILLDQ